MMTTDALVAAIEQVKVMRLMPGDRIVLRCPFIVHDEQLKSMRELAAREFPGHKIIVLDQGMDLEIVRSDDDGEWVCAIIADSWRRGRLPFLK